MCYLIRRVSGFYSKLGSADKWSRYAGDEYSGVWCDEASHFGSDLHDLLEMLGSRLRGVDGPKVMFWTLTGNGYNAAWEILEQRQDSDGEPLGLNIEVIRASTLDNPYIDAADKERFKRQYAGTGREEQALHGGFAAAQGLVYSSFSRDTHVIPYSEAVDRVASDWRIYGYDSGWNDPRVLLEIAKTGYGQLIVLDEYHEDSSHVEDAIAWLQQNHKPDGTIYAEHEPSETQKMQRAGFRVEKAEKSLDAEISEVRQRLKPEDDEGRTAGRGYLFPINVRISFGSSSVTRRSTSASHTRTITVPTRSGTPFTPIRPPIAGGAARVSFPI